MVHKMVVVSFIFVIFGFLVEFLDFDDENVRIRAYIVKRGGDVPIYQVYLCD